MLELNYAGIKDRKAWEEAGAVLPAFDPEALKEKTGDSPKWIHIGPGNIFRGYIAVLAQKLIEAGSLDTGLVVVSPTGPSTPESQYWPYDNLALLVTMYADGRLEKTVVGSVVEALNGRDPAHVSELARMFENPDLQMVSFTVTEKGYQIRGLDRGFQKGAAADIEAGPEAGTYENAMSLMASMLYRRFHAGAHPVTLVSMDNFSHNGDKLRDSILTIAGEWQQKGQVEGNFIEWLEDQEKVAFPTSCIDKITPGPDKRVARRLLDEGFAVGQMTQTRDGRPAAGFVNAESAEYLIIEDRFANGRPPLEDAGVYLTGRQTVDDFERMKVTTCLNPLHTAMSVYGCLLGYELIADEMKDEDIVRLIRGIGYTEGLPVAADPGIIDPRAFLDTVMEERLPNPYMPDTPQRIATDTSQKVPIRFGETIKTYAREGRGGELRFIPLAIAGWIRYLLGVDDEGQAFEVSKDPLLEELRELLQDVKLGQPLPEGVLRPILTNEDLFRQDLYKAGVGTRIEKYVGMMLEGPGAVRGALHKITREA